MTLLAWYDGVQAKKGEMRQIVVECHLLAPAAFVVAPFATRSQFTFMGIIFFVAGYASCCGFVAIEIALVTAIAFCFGMGAPAGEFRLLLVIEKDRRPFRRTMAGLAFRPVTAAVHVLQLMAVGADRGYVLVAFPRMASAARNFLVGAMEREFRL